MDVAQHPVVLPVQDADARDAAQRRALSVEACGLRLLGVQGPNMYLERGAGPVAAKAWLLRRPGCLENTHAS